VSPAWRWAGERGALRVDEWSAGRPQSASLAKRVRCVIRLKNGGVTGALPTARYRPALPQGPAGDSPILSSDSTACRCRCYPAYTPRCGT
jgi:hypothetical protein